MLKAPNIMFCSNTIQVKVKKKVKSSIWYPASIRVMPFDDFLFCMDTKKIFRNQIIMNAGYTVGAVQWQPDLNG